MPLDVFAALGALVRAEAARAGKKSVPRPVTRAAHERTGPPAPEDSGSVPADRPDAPSPAASHPPAAPERPLPRVLRRLAALFH
ncbi:hypothetical protein [Streptomyces sp. NPDC048650]|uniref:hypothetical protein n=1 Tax=unclassified Streptomyces TaxID=2593676 RepID=UPI00371F99DB